MLETFKQPNPVVVEGAQSVNDWLIDYLNNRRELGKQKYGMEVMAPNGREPLLDLIDELADAMVYAAQAYLEKVGEAS